uniref:C2H2-type domain-containing protein n=1 Tax=Leishmania guyanensis TaxID=5670 RepID=A0A1E1IRJ7_LEIGU|nr:hypothetical protein, conserved [Leishmania guyanensis]
MATTAFQFVQGNERLDWGILVSIDVERLMKSTNVGTLQRIIENIAFSRVTRDEAALLTPDHILHLFQLCQVVIQYLVYSQEILANINVKLNDRMEGQQATAHEREMLLQRLSDETALLKKQAKTQRRTLLAYEYNVHAALARGVTGSGAAPGVPATLYICPYCGDEYHKAESMQSHLRKRHNTTAGSTNLPVAGTATPPPPPPPIAGGGGGPTYGNHPASSIPPAAGGCIAAAGDAETLQQLRHRVEQLERDKEVMERQQRENLILMMLGASRSQPTSPPPQQQEQKPASAPSSTSLHPLVSPSLPPPSPLSSATAAPSATTTESALNTIPEHLQGIPVVPDISAMMNYNLSCQREASENALRRQLVSLEAEIRALRASKSSAASTVLSEAPPPPPQSTPGPCITASTGVPAGAWPAWVAELENAQQRQHQQQQQSTTTEAVPSLTPPSTPPPAPLLPPPPQQQQQRDYTTGVTAPSPVSPPSHSQSSSTQPASTSPAAPLIQAMPSLTAQSPLRSSSLAPQPSYGIQQQQQQHPPTVQPSTPSAPGLSTAVIPIPSPTTTAITEAGAPAAPTPTPSVSIPQPLVVHPKPHHGVESSTNSSLTSTSTLPPHRAVSKGPPGISLSHISATPWTLSTLTSTGVLGGAALATAAATSTSVAPIPLPSTTSTGLLAPPVSSPGLGVGSYFSSRTSVPAAATPALLPITPPPAPRDSSSPTQQYSYTAPLSTVSPSVSSTHNSPPPPATVPEPSVPHPTSVQPLRMTNTPLSHAPPLPVPVVAGSTSGNTTSVNSWSLPAPVPSIATVPVPAPAAVSGAVKPFRTLSSSSSSSSSSGSRFGAAGHYEY